jgi:hypothetical protein
MSYENIVSVELTPRHMECTLCGKNITEAFFVEIRPKASIDGDRDKIRSMCGWAADLELCDECMSHVMYAMETRLPGGGLLDGMITMNMGPEEMK